MEQETLELENVKKQETPASLKQIGYLARLLGVKEIPEDLTRTEASEWIHELVNDETK